MTHRAAIIEALQAGCARVSEINARTGIEPAIIHARLWELRAKGLVASYTVRQPRAVNGSPLATRSAWRKRLTRGRPEKRFCIAQGFHWAARAARVASLANMNRAQP